MGQAVTQAYVVEGMHCANCGMLIDETLEDIDGVRSSTTSLRTGRATVTYDPGVCSPSDVIAAIGEAGYRAHLDLP